MENPHKCGKSIQEITGEKCPVFSIITNWTKTCQLLNGCKEKQNWVLPSRSSPSHSEYDKSWIRLTKYLRFPRENNQFCRGSPRSSRRGDISPETWRLDRISLWSFWRQTACSLLLNLVDTPHRSVSMESGSSGEQIRTLLTRHTSTESKLSSSTNEEDWSPTHRCK